MRKRSLLQYEAANIICWFRIIISVGLAFMPRGGLVLAILFAMAFISDALDGWCYRKFTKDEPYQHWFNRLPITMDPIADFFLVAGGVVHVMDNKLWGLLCSIAMAVVLIFWNWLASGAKDRVYTILMTSLTYGWFIMMLIVVVMVWYHDAGEYWLAGTIVTVVGFYAIWFRTRVKSRTIRRRG